MRLMAVLACMALCALARAQEDAPPVRWPVIPRSAREAAGFAPPGWVVEASRTGDVNGDGIPDLVLMLQEHSPDKVLRDSQFRDVALDTNPRLLVVATGQREGPYSLLLANRTLIPRWTEWNLDDPRGDLEGFTIRRGSFTLPLHLFANAGGWETFERAFTFRVVGDRCLLVGYDEQSLQRNTGVTTTTSIDYLTGARRVTVETMSDTPPKVRRSRLPRRALLTIDQVGDGMAFEPR